MAHVVAVVEDVEARFVHGGAEQVRAQAGAAADHLPEFGGGVDGFEKHQVDDLGDVDAGVEHVHTDGDVQAGVGLFELGDECFRVVHAVGDHFGAGGGGGEDGPVLVGDEACVGLVAGEDDGLAQPVRSVDLQPLADDLPQHLPDRVPVEQFRVDLGGVDFLGCGKWVAVFVDTPFGVLPLQLLLGGEFAVGDAPAHEGGAAGEHLVGHKVALLDGAAQAVVAGRGVGLAAEEGVGVVGEVAARGGSQPDDEGVQVVEDASIALVDGSVGLVDNDEVEVERVEALAFADHADHGLVRVHVHLALAGGVGGQVDGHRLCEVLVERRVRLRDQRFAVGEEEHVADPAGLQQHGHGGDGDARLARTSRHDQQRAALTLAERLRHGLDHLQLVGPAGDLGDGGAVRAERLALVAPGDERLHRAHCWVGLNSAGFVAGTARQVGVPVPKAHLVPGGVEDQRYTSRRVADGVGVDRGLLAAVVNAAAGLLRLHNGDGHTLCIQQHIVHLHARHRVFLDERAAAHKPGLLQHRRDDVTARLRLIHRQLRRRWRQLLLLLANLLPQLRDLLLIPRSLFQLPLLRLIQLQFVQVSLLPRGLLLRRQRHHLPLVQRRLPRCLLQDLDVKRRNPPNRLPREVRSCEHHHVIQVLQRLQRLIAGDVRFAVHRGVAGLAQDVHLGTDRLRQQAREVRVGQCIEDVGLFLQPIQRRDMPNDLL